MEVLKIKTKSNGKDTKDKIIELFFTEHLRPVDISKKLKVGMPYITKIIQKDSRYIEEKEYRAIKSKERHKVCKRNYINKKRQADKQEYQACQCDPGDACSPDPSVPKPDLPLVGVQSGQAPNLATVLRHYARRHLEGALKGQRDVAGDDRRPRA